MHGLRDCQARVTGKVNISMNVPGGSTVFKLSELERMGFRGMKMGGIAAPKG